MALKAIYTRLARALGGLDAEICAPGARLLAPKCASSATWMALKANYARLARAFWLQFYAAERRAQPQPAFAHAAHAC